MAASPMSFLLKKQPQEFVTFRSIEIEVDVEGDMETGDLIFGELEERQEITAWQIPIELEYRQRNYRLGWQVGAGLVANLMRFKEANVSGKVKATQVEFPTVVREKEGEPGSTLKPLFGVQAGAGLHYHLSRQLSLRADAVIQYNRHLTNQHFQLGLAYQF
jgi:opacity protein-like surface antigen